MAAFHHNGRLQYWLQQRVYPEKPKIFTIWPLIIFQRHFYCSKTLISDTPCIFMRFLSHTLSPDTCTPHSALSYLCSNPIYYLCRSLLPYVLLLFFNGLITTWHIISLLVFVSSRKCKLHEDEVFFVLFIFIPTTAKIMHGIYTNKNYLVKWINCTSIFKGTKLGKNICMFSSF